MAGPTIASIWLALSVIGNRERGAVVNMHGERSHVHAVRPRCAAIAISAAEGMAGNTTAPSPMTFWHSADAMCLTHCQASSWCLGVLVDGIGEAVEHRGARTARSDRERERIPRRTAYRRRRRFRSSTSRLP